LQARTGVSYWTGLAREGENWTDGVWFFSLYCIRPRRRRVVEVRESSLTLDNSELVPRLSGGWRSAHGIIGMSETQTHEIRTGSTTLRGYRSGNTASPLLVGHGASYGCGAAGRGKARGPVPKNSRVEYVESRHRIRPMNARSRF
jgi:hypothetical protein